MTGGTPPNRGLAAEPDSSRSKIFDVAVRVRSPARPMARTIRGKAPIFHEGHTQTKV